jgi:dihydropteroate synthase
VNRLHLENRVAVMAIINRTPDSFYDDGATFAVDKAVAAALAAAEGGADLVDIGGVPFGRGPAVSLQEEIDRVVPVVEAIHAASGIVVSVDTFNAEVARLSIAAGAEVINDTSGLWDEDMAGVVAATDATLVLSHSLEPPRSEPPRPDYADVVLEVVDFLRDRVGRAIEAGVPLERLVVDPGHDLNKNTLHSLEITRRLEGSLAAAVVCVMKGARMVRVHDVRASVAAMRMTEALLGLRAPAYLRHNMGG